MEMSFHTCSIVDRDIEGCQNNRDSKVVIMKAWNRIHYKDVVLPV